MTNSARLSGRPSSSAAYNVGDVVDTPDSAIKSWRYLGAGEWEPNDVVRHTMGPGGGSAKRIMPIQSIDGRAQITRDWLLERFPLPTNRNIADRSNINLAGATLPTGVTAEWVDAPDEYGGKSLKLSFAENTPSNAHVILPLLPDYRSNYPKSLPRMEWRVMSSNFQTLNRLYLSASDDPTMAKRYIWVANDNSTQKSGWGLRGPYTTSVNNRYRTLVVNCYNNVSPSGGPTAWNETAPEYEIRAISINVILAQDGGVNIPGDLYINRVSSPEWDCGALITQMDGGYELSRLPIFHEFWRRGWPGVVSRLYADAADYIPDAYWPDFVRAGWDVCLHAAKQDVTAMDGTVTEQVLDKILQDWRRFAVSLGVQGPGLRTCSNLTNAGPAAIPDAAAILRRNGIAGARGRWSDEQYGVDPMSALTNIDQIAGSTPGGWSPRWGRYNRMYIDVSAGGATAEARNTFAGSHADVMIKKIVVGRDLGWAYIHRVMDAPTTGNIGPQFARDYIAAIEEKFSKQEIVPISATQADMLTYERPGDVYLAYDGAWKSRSTGKVAL